MCFCANATVSRLVSVCWRFLSFHIMSFNNPQEQVCTCCILTMLPTCDFVSQMLAATLITVSNQKNWQTMHLINVGGESNNITGTSFSSHKKVSRPLCEWMKVHNFSLVTPDSTYAVCQKQIWVMDWVVFQRLGCLLSTQSLPCQNFFYICSPVWQHSLLPDMSGDQNTSQHQTLTLSVAVCRLQNTQKWQQIGQINVFSNAAVFLGWTFFVS